MKKASEQELWYENIRYRFYPGLQVTFDKKTVNIRFAYKKNNGFSIADYNNPDEKKARNLQLISQLPPNPPNINSKLSIINCKLLTINSLLPWRSHPAKYGEGFDVPPTLERSGSEHRRAVTSFLLRRKAWLEVELPLAKGRRRDSKDSFFNGKEPYIQGNISGKRNKQLYHSFSY